LAIATSTTASCRDKAIDLVNGKPASRVRLMNSKACSKRQRELDKQLRGVPEGQENSGARKQDYGTGGGTA